jgi:hypothetical protein
MREICTSGLKRAEAAGLPAPPLLYYLAAENRLAGAPSRGKEMSGAARW